MFIDIHSHVLPDIDDGANTGEEALEMLRMAEDDGTAALVATPHFIMGMMENYSDIVEEKYSKLCMNARKKGVKLRLLTGCEIFLTPESIESLRQRKLCTLNHTSFILFELPMSGIPVFTDNALYNIQAYGYTAVMAHPERNMEFLRNEKILKSFVDRGILLQLNADSILGVNGRAIQKAALRYIKMGWASFVASDAHSTGRRSPRLKEAAEFVARKFGNDTSRKLFYDNARKILNLAEEDLNG